MRMLNRVALVLLGVVVALFVTEGLFRLLRLAPQVAVLTNATEDAPYIRSSNPALVYELKPNYRNPNPTNHHGSFSYVNAFGQRDIERQLERIPGKKRVILLGDSVVAGHGQPDLNETISRKLEQEFEGKVEVLNFGVGGYNTAAEVELLRVKGLKFSPDVVILMTVFNDGDVPPVF